MKSTDLKSNSIRESGNTTVVALLMLFVLSMVGANVLLNVTTRYDGTMKASGWQEALFAAEAGADIGFANVRWLATGGTANTPFASSSGWVNTSGTYTLTTGTFQQAGQGPSTTWAKITVDAPPTMKDQYNNQWYRVRSTGYAQLPGMSRVSIDTPSDMNARHSNALRKYSLKVDRLTGGVVSTPQAARRIEVIVQPHPPWPSGIIANYSFTAPGSSGVVDSFDSRDSTKSTGGLYDSSKRQSNGNVICNTANISIGGMVYGNVGDNGGNLVAGSNITGTVDNNMSMTLPPVATPTWTVIAPTPTIVDVNTTILAGTTAAPINYKISSITKSLTINPPAGLTTGAVNIWIPKDGSGNEISGSIHISPGVKCKIYIEGDIKMTLGDLDNQNNNAAYLQIYGLTPASGTVQDFTFQPGSFYGAIYAPYANIKFKGNATIMGSIVGGNIDGNGNTSVHYDEAINGVGDVVDFRRASYIEDYR